ncbi:hypothetical protein GCM10010172_61060 [Paractinoplanes ferrugineus]|uniref:Aromatic ring-opening dioxygenase LigA n=1 Tax=Paractinoplanes ferrugineus TaxID=113564 RepID=A0A919MCC6_9ACTN|nr:hypothetical protein [Actinoplanes ferrugineus]GIE14566.1 hypothetical protein Afe05nite_64060 [Actinoplanes ferrugineus]
MRRRTFDIILTAVGAVLAAGLLLAGGLLTWGYSFANSTVHDQLAAQEIYFPAQGSDALKSDEIGPYLNKYAGQKLTTGAQAEAYADHFIKVHLGEIAGGKTYAQISSEAQANPDDAKLAGQVQTLFRGETLRGMLLNAYAFWKFGQIALYSAIAAFAGALILLVLTGLGYRHARTVSPENQLFESAAA